MTERDALRAAGDELARTARSVAATRPQLPSYENNQPLAAIVGNGGVGLSRAEIDSSPATKRRPSCGFCVVLRAFAHEECAN